MPHVTLVSDLEPDADWSAFEQLVSLAQLLSQSGHTLSLWLSPKARELEVWPAKAEKLTPCPNWSTFDALKSLPFWLTKKTDILHFVPKMQAKNRLHAFTWLVPLVKGMHNPLVVSSFFSWPASIPFYLKQLLHLSELVITPSEYLRHLISSDSYSTAHQQLSSLPLFPHMPYESTSEVSSHYEKLKPFIYLPGSDEDWEDPVETLKQVLTEASGFKGSVVAGTNWTQSYRLGRQLQELVHSFVSPQQQLQVFFPEKMNAPLHQWLTRNSRALWVKGMRLSSLALSQSFEDCLLFEQPLLFSKLQSDLHSPHWAPLFTAPDNLGAWLNDVSYSETFREQLRVFKTHSLLPDPASQLNRLYSQSLLNTAES